ncbi:hypothetical protein [Kaarinaea lacus]
MKKLLLIITLSVLGSSAFLHAYADDRYDDHPPPERFKLRIGGFLIDRFDTTVRLDSNQFPIGTLIDLEENFNVDSSETVVRLDGFYRFNKRHRIDWTYYRSRRNGTAIATQEYIIGDPDDPEGGIVIPKDARISTQWNYDLLKLGYAYSFLNKRKYEMFIGAGLNIRNLDLEIEYQADLANFSEQDRIEGDGLVPLPTLVFGSRWNFTEKLQCIFRYELFMLQVGDYKGSQQDFQLLLEHSTFKHVGFGLGINTVDSNIRAQSDNLRGEFDSRILGLLGYTKIYF